MTGDLFRFVNDRIRELGSRSLNEIDFVCECGGGSCAQAIRLTAAEYDALRADPTQFAVWPGHKLSSTEIVRRTDPYVLVKQTSVLIHG
jgi:hypothetical protein